ncbi:cyclase [Lithospermum erythrorhizon]|uniref:Cyclase n=1 Tax=Lithospermum erythrorhizon TaxID=34254 RepID=A0AAV3R3R8_LITER
MQEDLYVPHTYVQDMLWNTLHYISEPIIRRWPFNKIRERAIKKAIKCMRYAAEESRYITTSSVEQNLQMICWWAEDPNCEEFKCFLARIPDCLWIAEDGMTVQTYGSQLWDCCLSTQALLASGMIEEFGDCLKKSHFYIKESQVTENFKGDYKSMYRHFSKGAWTFSDRDQALVISDCTAEGLKTLLLLSQISPEMEGEPVPVERLYDAVNFLLYMQSPKSGGFGIWEPPVPQPYMQVLNPSELFADIVVEQE